MAAIQIKDVSPEFLKGLKITALSEGKTLKDYVIEALMAAMDRSGRKSPKPAKQ